MTSALDRLLAAALISDDPKLRALAAAAQAERNRSVGRPLKLSPADPMVMFIVFDGIYARYYTDEVAFVDGEPLAITESTIDPTDAIARELMAYAGCSINTARKFAGQQINTFRDKLTAELQASGVRFNTLVVTKKELITALKAAKKKLTNNS